MEDHLLDTAGLGDHVVDVLNRGVAFLEPRGGFGDERRERPRTLDASANRMVQLGLAGEGVDQRVSLTDHQTGEVRDGDELLAPSLLLAIPSIFGSETSPLQRRFRKQLWHPRHARSFPQPYCGSVTGGLTAVDVQDLAGDECGPFEVEDPVDNVANLADPA
jgi:hypothetical protein